ncbi:hypothetical protein C266_05979 [Pandoraea sp. SD6-2]|nr:hypothetical protein C266_05979 [Pandoraea sp. SD6-2]
MGAERVRCLAATHGNGNAPRVVVTTRCRFAYVRDDACGRAVFSKAGGAHDTDQTRCANGVFTASADHGKTR